MYLNINDSRLINAPTRQDVINAIRLLAADQYVILDRSENTYIQTYYNEDGTFQLEYRDGSEDRHYAVDPETISADDVCNAFGLFFDGADVSSLLNWEKTAIEPTEPGEGEVEYNGVVMDAEWPEQIEAAQKIRKISLAGAHYARIPFGREADMPTSSLHHCGDCGVLQGQLHVPDCDIEQCPRCRGQLMSCGCLDLDDDN